MESFKGVNCRPKRQLSASQGLSLLEMALGLMILSILSVGVSALVKTGVESQMAHRTNQLVQNVGLNIVDDLRMDIRTAEKATANGNQLILDMPDSSQITYQLNGIEFSRTSSSGGTKIYNASQTAKLQVLCEAPCFTPGVINNQGNPRQIIVKSLEVSQVLSNSGNIIDVAFKPANFSIRNFSFEVPSATEFQ
jgi:Tfp pilus assembly protein PilV